MSPERRPDSTPLETPAAKEAKAHPGKPFLHDSALYLSTAAGTPIFLTQTVPADELGIALQTSPNGKFVVFEKHTEVAELWLASSDDGRLQRLASDAPDAKPEHNIDGFSVPQFSADGGQVYFMTTAWATSRAVHAIEIHSLRERFVVDANCLLVIRGGRYQGHLFVQRHRYKRSSGQRYGAYEWCGLVDENGRETKTLSVDESICPCDQYFSSPEQRRTINRALGIKDSTP